MIFEVGKCTVNKDLDRIPPAVYDWVHTCLKSTLMGCLCTASANVDSTTIGFLGFCQDAHYKLNDNNL